MPIYEYRCRRCEEEFETLVSLRQREEEVPCPACGERQGERRVSMFSARGTSGSGGYSGASTPGGCGPSGFS